MHSICDIAEVLIKLQQEGNVKYTGWVIIVPCSTKRKVVDKLQDQAKIMDHELKDWRRMVKRIRGNFYELNYFSTLQLLTLRRELGRIKNPNSPAIIVPDVLTLLQSISSQIKPSDISSAVRRLCTQGMPECDKQRPTSPEPEVEGSDDDIMSDILTSDLSPKAEKAKFKPSLSESQLTEDQREIMTNLIEQLDCPKQVILKAFEELSGKDSDRYDYENWCIDNLDQFEDEEGDCVGEESDNDILSSDSDDDDRQNKQGLDYSSGIISLL